MAGNSIPESARTAVRVREHFRCARCLVPAPNGHWHHRRSRLVRDQHRHCPCVGVWLCRTCHEWAHAHPFDARKDGFIISKFETEPWTIPIRNSLGERYQDCNGAARYY